MNATDYGYLHTQIRELKEKQVLAASKSKSKKYNVLLMVLDSTSFSMARRNLPTTLGYLKSEMGAVEFKFLNRVGIHSKQNGAALLLGKRAEAVAQFDDESTEWEQHMNLDDFWMKSMDEHPQIHKDFSDEEYVLKDTFVFITGDHGPKYGDTKLGALETDNPMLIIVPPMELQENKELMVTLRENSEKLQTHWDTRATLFDILKNQPSSNFSDRSPLDISKDGSSMLRKQEGERSCRTLPIPIEYCICRYPTEEKNVYWKEARLFAQKVIESVEEKLRSGGVADLCNKWTIQKVVRLTKVKVSSGNILHQITIALKNLPGAQFKATISDTDGKLVVGSVDRLDAYKNRGDCVPHDSSPICDCL